MLWAFILRLIFWFLQQFLFSIKPHHWWRQQFLAIFANDGYFGHAFCGCQSLHWKCPKYDVSTRLEQQGGKCVFLVLSCLCVKVVFQLLRFLKLEFKPYWPIEQNIRCCLWSMHVACCGCRQAYFVNYADAHALSAPLTRATNSTCLTLI